MQNYGRVFSLLYNKLWNDFSSSLAPKIELFYQENTKSNKKTLLDLCCGTGNLTKYFLEKGYYVYAVDISDDMLDYARINTEKWKENVSIMQQDARFISLKDKVDLVISSYDALNHLASLNDLQMCFERIYTLMENDGLFIFDINTEKGIKEQWNGINIEDKEDYMIVRRGIYIPEHKKGYVEFTGFIKNDNEYFERFSEVFFNSIFEIKNVIAMLGKIGYKEIRCYGKMDFKIIVDEPEAYNRIFISCMK